MTPQWKTAALGGLVGAAAAVAIVFGAARLGYFPGPSDKRLHDYMTAHPVLLVEMQNRLIEMATQNEERPIQEGIDKLGLQRLFDPKLAFVTGPANARKTFVEFFDYNCPHCRNSVPAVHAFYEAHKNDTRFAFIELPIFGGESDNAARAALAARLQPEKYVAFHFALMAGSKVTGAAEIIEAANTAGLDVNKLTADLKNPAIEPQLVAAHAVADRIRSPGTPLFIVNGKVHSGEITQKELEELSKG